jgi:lysophospholipase L1-like esterase
VTPSDEPPPGAPSTVPGVMGGAPETTRQGQQPDSSSIPPTSETGAGGLTPARGDGAAPTPGTETPPPSGATDAPALTPLPELARIVAVGDSITQSTCWRALLWQQLERDFPDRTDFVGTHASDAGCMVAGYDMDNEGYGSALVTEVAAGVTDRRTCNPDCPSLDVLRQNFASAPADVALVHFGTNDVWNGINAGDGNAPEAGSVLAAYGAVLEALRASNPSIRVFVAQLIPMNVSEATCTGCTCAECPDRVTTLNEQMALWAAAVDTAASPGSIVDQWTGFDALTDTRDGVHPNLTGSEKMASQWYGALAPLL